MNLSPPLKRTHRITIKVRKGKGQSKSFSIYTTKHSDEFLFGKVESVLHDPKLDRPMVFVTRFTSHVVILENLRTKKCMTKCFNLHQYSVDEIRDLLYKKFRGGEKK